MNNRNDSTNTSNSSNSLITEKQILAGSTRVTYHNTISGTIFDYKAANETIQFTKEATIRKLEITDMLIQSTQDGIELANLVKTKGITNLRLYFCRISADAITAYSKALQIGSHNLQALEFDSSTVTDVVLKQARLANPHSPFSTVTVTENQFDEKYWDIDGKYDAVKLPRTDTLAWLAIRNVIDLKNRNLLSEEQIKDTLSTGQYEMVQEYNEGYTKYRNFIK